MSAVRSGPLRSVAVPTAPPDPAAGPDTPDAPRIPEAETVQTALTDWCPEYRPLVTPSPGEEPVPMADWSDPVWLAARVAASHRRYRTDDARVAATLWWFSASTALLTPALATLVVTRWAVDPRPAATVLHMRRDGLPSGARSSGVAGQDPAAAGAVLGEAVAAYIDALAEVAPLRPRAAWAIAVDTIAGALLRAGTTIGEPDAAAALAAPLVTAAGKAAGVAVPQPRFTAFPGMTFVHRTSCCLLYRAPGQPMCTSCPGRRPAEREADLRNFADRYGRR